MHKIIMFMGQNETQEYFSRQLATAFEKMDYDIFFFDYEQQMKSSDKILSFFERGETVMFTFNFHGISGDEIFLDENGIWMWDALGIPCYNIVVDHPFYYHKFLRTVPKNYHHISIDLNHDAYVARFFPEIIRGPFLPLAGTRLNWDSPLPPIIDRPTDLIFTGSYVPPTHFNQYIDRIDENYSAFYHGIIDELLNHRDMLLEDVAERHIRTEISNVTEKEIKDTMEHMIFLDMYIRYYVRGEAVKVLADNGFKIKIYGMGWQALDCRHHENISDGFYVNSETCLEQTLYSKISLNVMPWFKNGAHDRIFNTMLNGAVCVTDSSKYLDTILKDNENCRIYSLDKIDMLPDIVNDLLKDSKHMQEIANTGYDMALASHTWEERAKALDKWWSK